MKLAVISGYASADYLVCLPSPLQGPQTVAVETLENGSWPRPGGAALYLSRHLSAAGHRAAPLIAVSDDANGIAYLAAAEEYGIDLSGTTVLKGERTPWCMLMYHDDGDYTCLIDRGSLKARNVTDAQQI